MDGQFFDRLVQTLGQVMSRRWALVGLVGGAISGPLAGSDQVPPPQ